MKNNRLIYSDFVSQRPEPTSYLELWCLLAGVINLLVVFYMSDKVISIDPTVSVKLAMFLPALFFILDYLSKEFSWCNITLKLSTVIASVYCGYLILFPATPHTPELAETISNLIFCLGSLVLVNFKQLRR